MKIFIKIILAIPLAVVSILLGLLLIAGLIVLVPFMMLLALFGIILSNYS